MFSRAATQPWQISPKPFPASRPVLLPPGPEGDKDARSLFSSIEKQLGVRVEPQTSSAEVLTVARANCPPLANSPGAVERFGSAPTEFEVADVHPSRPGESEDFKTENGRLVAKAIRLRDIIQFAWNAEDDALKGGEKWLETEKFDIVAKTSP